MLWIPIALCWVRIFPQLPFVRLSRTIVKLSSFFYVIYSTGIVFFSFFFFLTLTDSVYVHKYEVYAKVPGILFFLKNSRQKAQLKNVIFFVFLACSAFCVYLTWFEKKMSADKIDMQQYRLSSLLLPVQTFTNKMLCPQCWTNLIPTVRRNFSSDSFFPRNHCFVKQTPV